MYFIRRGCLKCAIFSGYLPQMHVMLKLLFVLVVVAFVVIALRANRRRKIRVPDQERVETGELLVAHVSFYRKLDQEGRQQFERRVLRFLSVTQITGVGVVPTYLDKVLVAASAIIPIYHFPDWEYRNIREVLLYGTSFSKDYNTEGADRNVLGMVGDGAMNGQMILSLPSLRSGFERADGHNTAIHEFVHLIDKADGSVDGVPEYLLASPYIIPWVNMMQEEIHKIRDAGSDINPYGGTNKAEFFAVIAEYFFEQPETLKTRHPALYSMLDKMFAGEKSEAPVVATE